jgi:hypothetical protein
VVLMRVLLAVQIGVTILQPVLTYYTNGWTFSSWNCCPQGVWSHLCPSSRRDQGGA